MLGVSGLRFRYHRGTDELFDGLSHSFAAGSVSVVSGASGSGKSTLLYLLGLLLTPVSGGVTVDGVAAAPLSDAARSVLRARHIGFVFQDAALDATRPILDNVVEGGLYAGVSRKNAETRARVLLDRFGVDLPAERRPGEISGGQAQRVGLCRALLKHPRVILADEPTGNLDHDSADVVLRALWDAAGAGATVVISTHDQQIVTEADDVVTL
ncbi:MAG: ATP-binding cassette domain-containing protein [Actinomycetota bacterium]|nr:ATP-binding cassette domain-containing protein [Actinomycetota bacterium]